MTQWAFAAIAALWLFGLGYLLLSGVRDEVTEEMVLLALSGLEQLALAVLVPCLYLLALWCHFVLLANRGLVVTRWLLIFLLFFAFLHPVCCAYALWMREPLLANQFLLPIILYTVLLCVFALNWFHMAAAPLRVRLSLLFFLLALWGQYALGGSLLMLLLPVFGWGPLRCLAQFAPLIVSLPPKG